MALEANGRKRNGQEISNWQKSFVDPWKRAGPRYRLGVILIFLGILAFVPSGIALGMLMTSQSPGDFGWASLVSYGVGVALIIVGNLTRLRAYRRYTTAED